MIMLAFAMTAGIHAQSLSTASNVKEHKVDRGSKMTAEERAKKQTAKLTETLDLDAEQQKAVFKIAYNRAIEMDANREQREEMKKRRAAVTNKSQAQIMEILTPEQQKKWEAEKAQRAEKRDYRKDKMRSENREAARAKSVEKKDCSKECAKTCDDKKK